MENCTGVELWVNDGVCDDLNNNIECNFDGGDCCGPYVNTGYCNECLCLNSSSITTTTTIAPPFSQCNSSLLAWIGDGFCDAATNNENCHFDDGDCCGNNVVTLYCENCLCHNSTEESTDEECEGKNNTCIIPYLFEHDDFKGKPPQITLNSKK